MREALGHDEYLRKEKNINRRYRIKKGFTVLIGLIIILSSGHMGLYSSLNSVACLFLTIGTVCICPAIVSELENRRIKKQDLLDEQWHNSMNQITKKRIEKQDKISETKSKDVSEEFKEYFIVEGNESLNPKAKTYIKKKNN